MIASRLKESIEQNVLMWFLGVLVTGFVSGLGAYRTVQDIAGLKVVSQSSLDDTAKKVAALEKAASLELAKSEATTVQLRQAYASLRGTRVGLMYVESDSTFMSSVKQRLAETGAIVTPNEVSQWRGYPEFVGRVLYRKGTEESAFQLKALVSDLAVATPSEYAMESDKYDVAIWLQPRR